jgi:hypothetical protein
MLTTSHCICTENICQIPVTLWKTSLSTWALAYCKVCQILTFKMYYSLNPHDSLTKILAHCVSDFNMLISGPFITKLMCLVQMQL